MNLIDVNVLVALYRPDHPHHLAATRWWEQGTAAGEPITVPDLVWVGFTRVVTHPRIFSVPATVDQAWKFAQAVMAQPTYLTWVGTPAIISHFAQMSQEIGARGDIVTDAYIAACAQSYGAAVVTFDRDFRRFDGVRVKEIKVA